MKQAILAVSFGTSYPEAEQSCILPVEAALAKAFPSHDVRRAYSSRIIMRKLRERGEAIESEAEALERLRREAYGEIAVVPTHILHGIEYEVVKEAAGDLRVSEPLLETQADLSWMAGLLGKLAAEEGRPLLMMGHGTEHAADETYTRLRKQLPENVYLACVEGEHSLERQLPALERLSVKEIVLMPLMLVAGDHAHNDMAGDDEDSWKSILTRRGFDVRVRMQGLGALPEVQARFVEKARKIV